MYDLAHIENENLEMIRSQHLRSLTLIALSFSAYAPLPAHATQPTVHRSQVPFVGCKSDGQVGPLSAPVGKSKSVAVAPQLAQRLAYYQAQDGIGVLAPRGWYCFGTYGSSGSNLYVTPDPIDPKTVFSSIWNGFAGLAIQATVEYGGTSGRFGVAEVIARVFPTHRGFVQHLIDEQTKEGLTSDTSFTYGPYPNDKLTYRNSETVEYLTPANSEGLGTRSRLQKSGTPIAGVVVLVGADTDLVYLSSRLPTNLANLTTAIVGQVEHDAANPTQ